MTGRHSCWLVSLPVVLAGCLAAHLAAYALVEPSDHARRELLARSGHGYLAELPLLAAGVLVVLLGAVLHHALRGRTRARPPAALFVVLPPLAFAVQEHLERLLHTGEIPVAAALEPTFLVGLALQVPFAVLAWILARAVLRAAELLRPRRPVRPTALRAARLPLPASAVIVRLRPVAAGEPGRGPPLPV